MMAQSRILAFWYFMTYLLLEKNKPKYQPLEPPPVNQPEPQSEPDQTEPQSEPDQPDEPVESDDSPGQSFEILETPTANQGKPDPLQLESPPPATTPLNLFDLDGL